MKKQRFYVLMGLLLILVPIADYQWRQWNYWNNFERIVVWDDWKVTLPQGGSVTYRNQSPRVRLIGPADTTKLLIWQKLNGQTQDYLIGFGGAGYGNLEFRLRTDRKGVWLISHDWKKVVASLDLGNGEFTGEGGIAYNVDGGESPTVRGFPTWAGLKSGNTLGRKKF